MEEVRSSNLHSVCAFINLTPTDASELFHSYHVFCHEKAVKVLQKYEVKTSTFDAKKAYEDLPEPKSMYDWETESEFAKDLKQRVEPVVKKYGVRGTWFRTLYYIFLWVQVLLCFKPFVQGNWLMLFLFPLTLFFCNVHCSHDGRFVIPYSTSK